MIDTHCHLTSEGLHEQVEQVLLRATAAGVDRMITVGTTPSDSHQAVALADRFANVFATVGLQPHDADEWPIENIDRTYDELAGHRKVVALGEMGLDKFYDDPPLPKQRLALERQLELARQLSRPLPIIIHNRLATDETLQFLRDSGIPGSRFVFHCFTGDEPELRSILDFGSMVSFTGIVTFRNAQSLAQCAKVVPLDRLMIETDSPYLTPEPFRKVRPNEPCYVPLIAKFLAREREMDEPAFIKQVDANAERFFSLM